MARYVKIQDLFCDNGKSVERLRRKVTYLSPYQGYGRGTTGETMKYYSCSLYFIFCMFISASEVNAGSFRDFILDADISSLAQQSVAFSDNSESAACMKCHNGNSAKVVNIKHAETAMTFTSHGSSNHPVGMSYDSYVRKDPASYVVTARLDSRVRLENGQVTCISCHEAKQTNLHNQNQVAASTEFKTCNSTKSLTTGPVQTRLCMSCHAM